MVITYFSVSDCSSFYHLPVFAEVGLAYR